MKIGIDLDGVCYDFTAAFCRYVGHDPDSVNKWAFYEDWGWSANYFLSKCSQAIKAGQLFKHGDLLPGTKEAFTALGKAGHTIHIITDRAALDPAQSNLIMQYTRDWLNDEGLYYESLHFTGDKVTIAENLELDFFIDDKVENVQSMTASGFKAFLFDRAWNEGANFPRVREWSQFVEAVRLYASLKIASKIMTKEEVYAVLADKTEVRTVSATGGEKGQKLARIGSLDPKALMEVAKVAGFGEQKYSRLNYLKGYDWSLSYDAAQRHLHAFWSGEDLDPESGLPHLAHAAWHCLAQLAFLQHGLGTDDRYKPGEDVA